jgi:hypothetical protein
VAQSVQCLSYGLEDRDLILGRGRDLLFATASRQDLEPIQPPIQRVPGARSPGVKR